MLDTPRTWRYQSAVLLGPRPNLPDQPNSGPEEGWGAPFERRSARSVLHGAPAAETLTSTLSSNEPRKSQARSSSSQLLMQASQQVSLLAPSANPGFIPGAAVGVRAFAGVAQLVEHLFCKQVVSGSIPLASSSKDLASFSPQVSSVSRSENSEGCPSGQREEAVNLPAHAYVGSNPTPSTNANVARTARGPQPGMRRPRGGLTLSRKSAGVTQLVESQFSKLMVDGSSPFSRSTIHGASRTKFDTVCVTSTNIAHLAQLVEHVLGKDEVTSSSLVVGSTEVQP